MAIEPFSDEQSRVVVNLASSYAGWIEAERAFLALPYDLKIREINGTEYLYHIADRVGNGRSLGRVDEAARKRFDDYRAAKAEIKDRRQASQDSLTVNAQLYRTLRLPMLPSEAGRILREADRRGMLGREVMVVGTNAMAAYAIEANGFIGRGLDETQDFDLAWRGDEPAETSTPLWDMLKAADSTYSVNTERPFQARNRAAYEVEILVAPSRVGTLTRRDQPKPVPLPEQEWLLWGTPVDRIVGCRDASPARLLVPDPRYFALQKLWLSDQAKRDPAKRPKDRRQGTALLGAVAEAMPRYPLDDAFAASLPAEFAGYFTQWREGYTPPQRRAW